MNDNPLSGGLKIGSYTLPPWALYVGAGGLVLMLVVLKNKSGSSGEGPTVTDTGTGLLASEFDQRLREQWEAWQAWLEDYLKTPQGPVDAPGVITQCASGQYWNGQKCVSEQAGKSCGWGSMWNGTACVKDPSYVPAIIEPVGDGLPSPFWEPTDTPRNEVSSLDILFQCGPNKTWTPQGCLDVATWQDNYVAPEPLPDISPAPEGVSCPAGMVHRGNGCYSE